MLSGESESSGVNFLIRPIFPRDEPGRKGASQLNPPILPMTRGLRQSTNNRLGFKL